MPDLTPRVRIAALIGSHTVVRDGRPVSVYQAVGGQAVDDIAAAVADDVVAPLLERVEQLATGRLVSAIFSVREDAPQPFALERSEDVSGVSGEGIVAHGAQFSDGTVVIRWLGERRSTVIWQSLDDAIAVHGHDGRTRAVWLAEDIASLAELEQQRDTARAALREIRDRHHRHGDRCGACEQHAAFRSDLCDDCYVQHPCWHRATAERGLGESEET